MSVYMLKARIMAPTRGLRLPRNGRILVTGSEGQIGSELSAALELKHGVDALVWTVLLAPPSTRSSEARVVPLDVTDLQALNRLVRVYDVSTIYHLAAVLSAVGETKPDLAWHVNVEGLHNVLSVAADLQLAAFWPSSLAVFGDDAPLNVVTRLGREHGAMIYVDDAQEGACSAGTGEG
jgi:nucleoside-diphosphate-sugar epimerase